MSDFDLPQLFSMKHGRSPWHGASELASTDTSPQAIDFEDIFATHPEADRASTKLYAYMDYYNRHKILILQKLTDNDTAIKLTAYKDVLVDGKIKWQCDPRFAVEDSLTPIEDFDPNEEPSETTMYMHGTSAHILPGINAHNDG